ncbi:hypothetical protein BOKEGFJH_00317 [Chlamydia avium]|uniref:SEC-C motif family protein n=1 Tax=Chlamydia avium TaxID=1457141 RepID=A0ABN0MS27_9CHLA|nr:SEC-C metal-binding domain-containing protein [Chlamydia avium]EPP37706.1 SEC-C motif family protein [Chlamydia psittaci 10_743_SC13]EPP38326.1 SEC-C motif family protein [Chlamydia avium]VVT42803.1 hypothetical protein BOKEGFJH_00317 [Chlamydia avium]
MSKKINRNSPCPCGSNKKYKQCCLQKNSQPARYTSEGKFKFSAEVLSSNQSTHESTFSKLFQRLSENLLISNNQTQSKYHQATKNKSTIGKRTIKKAKAEEEQLISEKLNQYHFEVMNTSLPEEDNLKNASQQTQDHNVSSEEFIPTQKDYRVQENIDSDLEENN